MKQTESPTTVISKPVALLLFVTYAVLICTLAWFHEPWRDEVRAWSLIQEMTSLGDFFAVLHSEGHPPLWYALLTALDWIVASPVVLKFAAAGCALIAAWLVVRSSSFSVSEKALWLLGVLPLYEYSVQCRNYGIGMLFLFLYCTCYQQRFLAPIRNSLLLLLLANTSALGCILSAALFTVLIVEILFCNSGKAGRSLRNLLAAGITMTGFLATAWMMYPSSDSLVTSAPALSLSALSQQVLSSLLMQSYFAIDAFSLRFKIPAVYFLVPFYILFRKRPLVCLYLFLVAGMLDFLHHAVYGAYALRHQGFLVLAVFSAVWLYRFYERLIPNAGTSKNRMLHFYLLVVLVLQIDSNKYRTLPDLYRPMTAAPAAARRIQKNPAWEQAIIIAEPDYYAESLSYYLPNRIYLPREKRFRRFVSFTRRNAKQLSLHDLIDTARRLEKRYQTPVLLLYGHSFQEPGSHRFSYDKTFSFTESERQDFRTAFVTVADFRKSQSDEKYRLYRFDAKAAATLAAP